MIYGKAQRQLPFEIGLKDFQKKDYPGMSMARGFSSDVSVYDQGAPWEARIEMNAPLRYKGYTFYQSSFDQSAEGETTVLSVVENKGRIFPYLGTFIITLGLLLHLWIVFVKRRQA
jgi:cytochrome c biogenesis protein ResB